MLRLIIINDVYLVSDYQCWVLMLLLSNVIHVCTLIINPPISIGNMILTTHDLAFLLNILRATSYFLFRLYISKFARSSLSRWVEVVFVRACTLNMRITCLYNIVIILIYE